MDHDIKMNGYESSYSNLVKLEFNSKLDSNVDLLWILILILKWIILL